MKVHSISPLAIITVLTAGIPIWTQAAVTIDLYYWLYLSFWTVLYFILWNTETTQSFNNIAAVSWQQFWVCVYG